MSQTLQRDNQHTNILHELTRRSKVFTGGKVHRLA